MSVNVFVEGCFQTKPQDFGCAANNLIGFLNVALAPFPFMQQWGTARKRTVKDPEPSGFVVANVIVKLSCSSTLFSLGS
jgi:hypothetical protein